MLFNNMRDKYIMVYSQDGYFTILRMTYKYMQQYGGLLETF